VYCSIHARAFFFNLHFTSLSLTHTAFLSMKHAHRSSFLRRQWRPSPSTPTPPRLLRCLRTRCGVCLNVYIYINENILSYQYVYTQTNTHSHMHVCLDHRLSKYSCIYSLYIYLYMYTYIHTYIHTYMHSYRRTKPTTCKQLDMNLYIHTNIHIYLHIYIHTYLLKP